MTDRISAWANLTLAMIIVGSSVVFGKLITREFPVFLASCIRFAIASAVMVPLLIRMDGAMVMPSRKDLVRLIGMAFCGQFVFTALVLMGLRYTSAIEAGIITSTSPAMMAVVAFLLFRERPTAVQLVAVLLAVGGVISVNGLTGSGLSLDHMAGNLMMVGAVTGEAVFLLMRKTISPAISNMMLTGYLCIAGGVMFFPFAVYQGIGFDFDSVSAGAWWAMLYFGAVFTVLAYLFWFRGVSRVSGATAGLFSAVMPVSGVVLSCVFLKEVFTLSHGIGMAMVISGIVMTALTSDRSAGKPAGSTVDSA